MKGRQTLRRRLFAVLSIAGGITLLARPVARAGTDVFSNIGPAPSLGGAARWLRYPLTHYGLDQHFSAITTSLTGGIDTSGLLPMIAWFFASLIWLGTSAMSWVMVELFAFAFSLDLVNGSSATGGAGALGPVSQAIHSIYANVFGSPWLVLALSAVAIWAMWKALVQRRYSETAGALAMSLIYIVIAFFFVAQPGQTIGAASKWTNEMSQAFLSISTHGSPSGGEAATADDADQLWSLMVAQPWTVLEFGGVEHCAIDGTGDEDSDPQSAPVRPLSKDAGQDGALSRSLAAGTEVSAEGKTCINNENKYASHFLRFGFGTDERNEEYDALNHGDSSKLPDADKEKAGYKLGVPDKPATDAMEEGGQYQRLGLAFVVALGDLGAFLLLGSLSVLVILSQVLLLLLLAFSPVALVAAAIPGRGHDFFKSWLEKLGGYLLRKAGYSLVLAILLAVNSAIAGATSQLGWLFSFGLQSVFFWAVLIQRRTLVNGILGVATGPRSPGGDLALDAIGLYAGARLGIGSVRGAGRAVLGAGRFAGRRVGGRRAEWNRTHPAGMAGTYESHALDHGQGRGGPGGQASGGGPEGAGSGPGGPGTGPAGSGTPPIAGPTPTAAGSTGTGTGGKGGGSTEAKASASSPEAIAAPPSDQEGKVAGRGAEATTDRRRTRPAGSTEAGTGDPSPEALAAPPSDPEGTAGGQGVEAGGPAAKEQADGPVPAGASPGRSSRRPRQGAGSAPGGDPSPSTREDGGTAATVDVPPSRRSGQQTARSRPDSPAIAGAGPAKPKPSEGSNLGDDLRAERERASSQSRSPETPDPKASAGVGEQLPDAAEPAPEPDLAEPSSPPRRRPRMRLPRVWRRGR